MVLGSIIAILSASARLFKKDNSMSQDDTPDIESQIEEAAKKLNVDVDILRDITEAEIQYLLDHCPFLQIVGPDMEVTPPEVQIVQSESGWDIHDYGDAISSSPGRFLMGGGNFRIYFGDEDDDEGGSGGDVINPGKGTIHNQAFVTAAEMVSMGHERGWHFFTIVDGHRSMKRAAWIKATEYGMVVDGFEPTEADEKIRQRILKSAEEIQTQVPPKPTAK